MKEVVGKIGITIAAVLMLLIPVAISAQDLGSTSGLFRSKSSTKKSTTSKIEFQQEDHPKEKHAETKINVYEKIDQEIVAGRQKRRLRRPSAAKTAPKS